MGKETNFKSLLQSSGMLNVYGVRAAPRQQKSNGQCSFPETWHITHTAEASVQLFCHRQQQQQQGSKGITG
jgi:hypothetical protein